MSERAVAPTQSAFLELKEERAGMREGDQNQWRRVARREISASSYFLHASVTADSCIPRSTDRFSPNAHARKPVRAI